MQEEHCSVRTGGQKKPATALQLGLDVKDQTDADAGRVQSELRAFEQEDLEAACECAEMVDSALASLHPTILQRPAPLLLFNGLHELCTATGATVKAKQTTTETEFSDATSVEFHTMLSRVAQHETTARTSTSMHDARRPYTTDGAAAPCAIAQQAPRREHGVSCEWTCPCAGPRHHECKVCQTSITSRQPKTGMSVHSWQLTCPD